MFNENESVLCHHPLGGIIARIRHFLPQNLICRTLVWRKIMVRNSYKMTTELVSLNELVHALDKFSFVLALDCHTRTAVPPVAALLLIDLPAVTSVQICNNQTVSIYGITNIVTAVTAVTVLKRVSTYGISNAVTVCSYSCYCTKDSQYLRYQKHTHCLLLQLLLY